MELIWIEFIGKVVVLTEFGISWFVGIGGSNEADFWWEIDERDEDWVEVNEGVLCCRKVSAWRDGDCICAAEGKVVCTADPLFGKFIAVSGTACCVGWRPKERFADWGGAEDFKL